jgi:hypothetical protein
VISATRLANFSVPPYKVSSDFGKLEARRQFNLGKAAADADVVKAANAAAPLAACMNLRLCMRVVSSVL